jgi:type II secretory pathway pseudopilin PulG
MAPYPLRSAPPRAVRRRAGVTMVELLIVLVVMTIAVGMLSGTLTSTSRIAPLQRENALAVLAARSQFETMRAQPFALLFALYNDAAADDPSGPGTAPGPGFAVPGLTPPDGEGAFVGRVVFPGDGTALREDADMPLLGMPRDLDGDGAIGATNVAGSYRILPVELHLRWQSSSGPRELRLHTMFVSP